MGRRERQTARRARFAAPPPAMLDCPQGYQVRRRCRALAGVLALLALSPCVHATEPAKTPIQIDARAAGALGDGVHDDRVALQGALDRLAVAGGVLDLPAGV